VSTSDIDVEKLEVQPFVKRSVTTGPGNVGGTTLVDAALTEPNDFWNGMAILIRTAGPTVDCSLQLRRVLDYDLPTHTLTVNVAFSGQIEAGVQYVMFFPTIFQTNIVPGGGLKADLRQVLGQGADLSPVNPMLVDVVNRAARQLGIVYGNQAQLQQVPATLELITQDTGLNTNPEKWMHDHHWECDQVTVAAGGAGGQQNLGAAVPVGVTRRIRVLHVRHAGTNNTVVTLLIAGGAVKRSWDIPAQTTRTISSEDGWSFAAAQQPAVQTSDVTGGSTYVGAEGVQA
jgi:hypothetical protein